MTKQTNIFGDSIEECCSNPVTGFYRDGFCRTDDLDRGLHVVFEDGKELSGVDAFIYVWERTNGYNWLAVEGEVVARMTCEFKS